MTDCKWMQDEICVNADCPMRADYCPVADNEGVCRFEDRTADSVAKTDKERLVELIQDYDCKGNVICDECGGCTETCIINEKISPLADYLIANGVVVQKQGEWSEPYLIGVDDIKGRDCSECGYTCGETPLNYCSKCGAKMVKEDK